MEIRNNAEALNAFLGVSSSRSMDSRTIHSAAAEDIKAALAGDEATLSSVGAAMQGAANPDGVRLGRVAAVQQALAAGTYNVPASQVAEKIVETMLTSGIGPKGR